MSLKMRQAKKCCNLLRWLEGVFQGLPKFDHKLRRHINNKDLEHYHHQTKNIFVIIRVIMTSKMSRFSRLLITCQAVKQGLKFANLWTVSQITSESPSYIHLGVLSLSFILISVDMHQQLTFLHVSNALLVTNNQIDAPAVYQTFHAISSKNNMKNGQLLKINLLVQISVEI